MKPAARHELDRRKIKGIPKSILEEVDTSAGHAGILRSWAAPSYVKLFYVPSFFLDRGVPVPVGPLLIGLKDDGAIGAFDPTLGREVGSDHPILDSLDRQLRAIANNGQVLYLADEAVAVKVECFPRSGPLNPEPDLEPCNDSSSLIVTEIDLNGQLPGSPPRGNNNRIGDVTLTSDGATLYVVGRRTIFAPTGHFKAPEVTDKLNIFTFKSGNAHLVWSRISPKSGGEQLGNRRYGKFCETSAQNFELIWQNP